MHTHMRTKGRTGPAVLLVALLLALPVRAATAAPAVVASIKPVHALVAMVMQGIGTPTLLIRGAASPHSYALRPSDARALAGADVVFWIGPELETFLERPLAALGPKTRRVALLQAPGLRLLPARHGGLWEEDEDEDEHGHEHGAVNPHVWLSTVNARAMLAEITRVLAAADPANAARYAANRDAALTTLDALDGEVRRLLQPVRARRYIVFHDAYGYFEKEFGLAPAGSISVAPGRPPGARRLAAIRQRIAAGGVACVFREPQFEPTLVQTILEGTRAQSGVLDSLGADLPAGPGAYPALIRNLARSLHDCLQGAAGKD